MWDKIAGIGAGIGTTILTGGNVGAGAAAASAVTGIVGGGGNAGACPGQPSDARVTQMIRSLSSADRQRLESAWHSIKKQSQALPIGNPAELAKQSMGGSDCKTTSAEGQQLRAVFLELVEKYAPATGWTNDAPPQGGTSWNPPSPGIGGVSPAPAASTPWTQQQGGTGTQPVVTAGPQIDYSGCVRIGEHLVCGSSGNQHQVLGDNNMLMWLGVAALGIFLFANRSRRA